MHRRMSLDPYGGVVPTIDHGIGEAYTNILEISRNLQEIVSLSPHVDSIQQLGQHMTAVLRLVENIDLLLDVSSTLEEVLQARDQVDQLRKAAEQARDLAIATAQEIQHKIDQVSGTGLGRFTAIASAGSELVLDFEEITSEVITIILDQPVCVISLVPLAMEPGHTRSITLLLKQGTGANKVIWSDAVSWAYGRQPVLSFDEGKVDCIQLITDPFIPNQWLGAFDLGWFYA